VREAFSLRLLPALQVPLHAALPWHVIHGVRHSFIYDNQKRLVAIAVKQFEDRGTKANAELIVRASNHHYELLRLVKAGALVLADACDENAWPRCLSILGEGVLSASHRCSAHDDVAVFVSITRAIHLGRSFLLAW